VLQCVAVCCSVLQCVAVCCSVLQCVAVCCSVLQCAAVCCSMLQCVCCIYSQSQVQYYQCVLQCVAVCCSVLQCVAVCCSVCAASTFNRKCNTHPIKRTKKKNECVPPEFLENSRVKSFVPRSFGFSVPAESKNLPIFFSKDTCDFCQTKDMPWHMGCLQLVGSLNYRSLLQKSPIKETMFCKDDILQKKPISLRNLLIVATPYDMIHLYVTWFIICDMIHLYVTWFIYM